MSRAKKIPTSKLIFETVYPGHVEVKTRIGVEEEIFLRLTKEFKLPPEVVHKFIYDEQEKISARGDNLDSYFFDSDRTLDESLIALYSGADVKGRVVSSATSLNEFTFSEYSFFQGVTSALWNYYKKRQVLLRKGIETESRNIDKMISSNSFFSDKEVAIEVAERRKAELIGKRNRESELIGIYNMFANLCLTKSLFCLNTDKNDNRAIFRLIRELLRVYKDKTSPVAEDLKGYLDINNDFYQHDTDLLNKAGVSGYSFTKK